MKSVSTHTLYNGKRKCFICLKEGYWSSKHPREERDESRKQFKERFSQRFDKKAAKYISDFEGVESSLIDNLGDDDLNEMESLIMDIPSSPSAAIHDENSKAFFSLCLKMS